MTGRPAPPIWDVVEEHLDEAAFCWGQWERALVSPRYLLGEVADGPEERLLAHLEGLAAGGPEAAPRLLSPALEDGDPGKVAAAAAALASAGALDALRGALGSVASGRVAGRAVGLALAPGQEALLEPWLAEGPAPARVAALRALGQRRLPVPGGLLRHLRDAEPEVVRSALLAAPASGEQARPALEAALSSRDGDQVEAALWSAGSLGLAVALGAARRILDEERAGWAGALALIAVSGDRADLERLVAALERPAQREAALRGLGGTGRPEAGDACLPFLGQPELARQAFEALTAIAGPTLGELVGPAPPEGEASLQVGPVDDLPWPDADLVESAWRRGRARLSTGQRHLDGRPLQAAGLVEAFTGGSMRRRQVLGRELVLRGRGALHLPLDGFTDAQRSAQEGLASLRLDPASPLERLLRR